jgi:hypothetical protein
VLRKITNPLSIKRRSRDSQTGSGDDGAGRRWGKWGFYITYIQGRFRIYCKAALCWGVGAKGEVGFEVDGSSFAAFMKSFMFIC